MQGFEGGRGEEDRSLKAVTVIVIVLGFVDLSRWRSEEELEMRYVA